MRSLSSAQTAIPLLACLAKTTFSFDGAEGTRATARGRPGVVWELPPPRLIASVSNCTFCPEISHIIPRFSQPKADWAANERFSDSLTYSLPASLVSQLAALKACGLFNRSGFQHICLLHDDVAKFLVQKI